MNFLDVIIIIPMIYASYKGFRHGLIIEVFTFLALFVGLYAGIHFSDAAATFFKDRMNFSSTYLPVVSFTLVFLGLGAMTYYAGKTIEHLVKVVHLSLVNKLFGSLFALIKAIYFLSVALVLIDSYDERSRFFPKEKKESSYMYLPLKKVSELTVPGIQGSNLFLKNTLKTYRFNNTSVAQ